MYGKHFDSMYSGSMVGAGFAVFSIMGYVIANMKPDRVVGFQVDLNTKILSATFGEDEGKIAGAIEYLCQPDPESRTAAEEGRRLVKVGAFSYRVVNGVKYDKIRNEEERREQNRQAQIRHREKSAGRKRTGSTPMAQRVRDQAEATGDTVTVQRIDEMAAGVTPGTLTASLPQSSGGTSPG